MPNNFLWWEVDVNFIDSRVSKEKKELQAITNSEIFNPE